MQISINYGVIDIQYSPKHQMYSTKNWLKAIKYYFSALYTKGKNIKIADANPRVTARPTVCTTIHKEDINGNSSEIEFCPFALPSRELSEIEKALMYADLKNGESVGYFDGKYKKFKQTVIDHDSYTITRMFDVETGIELRSIMNVTINNE